MKLNVEIESGPFEKVIQEGISALSKEELGSIIKQVIHEAFTKCEDFKNLLIKEKRGYNGSEWSLGPLAQEAVKSINMDEELAEIKKKMVKALMDNHLQIVEDMLFRCMVDKITYDDHFIINLKETIRQINWEEKNRG